MIETSTHSQSIPHFLWLLKKKPCLLVESPKNQPAHITRKHLKKDFTKQTWVMPCITTTVTIVVGYDVHVSLFGDSFGLFVWKCIPQMDYQHVPR